MCGNAGLKLLQQGDCPPGKKGIQFVLHLINIHELIYILSLISSATEHADRLLDVMI